MPSPRPISRIAFIAVLGLAASGGAFRTNGNGAVPVPPRDRPRRRRTRVRARGDVRVAFHHEDSPLSHDDSLFDTSRGRAGRRKFLEKLSSAMAGTLAPSFLPPRRAAAAEAGVDNEIGGEPDRETAPLVETAAREDDDETGAEASRDTAQTPPDGESPPISETTAREDGDETGVEAQTLIEDEAALIEEVVRDEGAEKKSIEDELGLIGELEAEIATAAEDDANDRPSSSPEEMEREFDKLRGETEALLDEEENLKGEAEGMIVAIEAIESEAPPSLLEAEGETTSEGGGDDGGSAATVEGEMDAFADRLKERVREKEDLIARLKRESERDIDPKTGKFRAMSRQQYNDRVKSTEVDFLGFLRDTVANEREWERDLEAFEGFLRRRFEPAAAQGEFGGKGP